jgi:predicted acyltransferase
MGTEVHAASAATAERAPEPRGKTGAQPRVASLDAFRGTVMTLMLAEVLRLPGVARALPQSAFWGFIGFHTSHVAWQGGSLHDMIQPGFSFLVGAALPFSIASRRAKGQSVRRMLFHAAWRSLVLIFLGIFLRSFGKPQTNFTFEDTLTQIGLGYFFLFLLGFVSVRAQVAALVLILVGYWGLFAAYPAPPADFDYTKVGVPAGWEHHYSGFLSHWNKNSNAAWAFDRWFLNLFPRERPFEFNGGGYATLSFIPTLGTMLLGLLAGNWLKSARSARVKLLGLAAAGAGLLAIAYVLQWTGVCPIVKRIWTTAFTLYSGGWVLLILAGFYALMEWKGWRRWAFPLLVVGMNSIAIYVMSWTMEGFVAGALERHIPKGLFLLFGPVFETTLLGVGVMLVFWLILFWMYRRKIFLRI